MPFEVGSFDFDLRSRASGYRVPHSHLLVHDEVVQEKLCLLNRMEM